MRGMKNVKSRMGLLWLRQWYSQIRKRRASHTVTRPGKGFCSVRHDVLTQVSTGEGLRTFWLSIRVPSSWTAGPEDEGKLDSRRDQTSKMTWIFTTTVVPKRRQETTSRPCVKSQNIADLIYTAFEAWNHATVEVLRFLLLACQENAQTKVLYYVVHVYGGHFSYKKIIPQQVKGKNRLKTVTCWGCLWQTFTVRSEGWTLSVCLVNIWQWWIVCASVASFFQILCCVCSEAIMARRA